MTLEIWNMQKNDQRHDHLKDHVDYKKYQKVNVNTKYSVFNKRKGNFVKTKNKKVKNG